MPTNRSINGARGFQNIMNNIFTDTNCVLVYLNNILILNNNNETYEQHLEKCAKVFKS